MLFPSSNHWTVALGVLLFLSASATGIWAFLVMRGPYHEGTAEVTSARVGSSGQGEGTITFAYQYYVDGRLHTGTTRAGIALYHDTKVSDVVTVYYLQRSPSISSLFTFPRTGVWFLIPALLSVVGLLMIIDGINKSRASPPKPY